MLASLAVLSLAACTGPLSTLEPAGPLAERVATLWWIMLGGAVLILVGVMALALGPFLRLWPERSVSTRLYLWVGGLAFPTGVLTALMIHAFALETAENGLGDGAPPLEVEAIARRWSWTFVYPSAPGGPLAVQDRLHLPVGRAVRVSIRSEDVIHSFWIPRLAGKRDAIPGRVNALTLVADAPGRYRGVCSEFCGRGHADMSFVAEAHAPGDFDRALARLAAAGGEAP